MTKTKAGSLARYPAYTFEQLGWKDLNPNIDILTEYGIKKVIYQYLTKQFKLHTDNSILHPYGKLSYKYDSKNTLSSKLMLRDCSNANPDRETAFFPYETIYLKPNDQILNGYGRCYDNGLLEFDIVFRLGYAGYREIDSEYHISADILSCNNLDLKGDETDQKYFYANSDADIFGYSGNNETYKAELGSTLEYGRTSYCNVYYADIEFSQDVLPEHRFANTDYMIFSSDVMCQDRDIKYSAVNVGANSMVFAKKHMTGFTAIYVTYPNALNFGNKQYNAQNGGLQANSFHCHVVGKWK